MNAWSGSFLQWAADASLSMSFLALLLLGLRRKLGAGIRPAWLVLAGWLTLGRLLMPVEFFNPYALDTLWKNPPLFSNVPRQLVLINSTAPAGTSPPPGRKPVSWRQASNPAAMDEMKMPVRWSLWAVGVWAVGTSGFSALLLLQHFRFRRHLAGISSPCVLPWPGMVENCARSLGIRCPPRILEYSGDGVPFATGLRHPVIYLPKSALDQMSPNEARHVLLHEMMHIVKKDLLANWFLTVLRAVYWFNPLVHITCRNLVRDREIVRDSQIIRLPGVAITPTEYGRTLLKLAVVPLRTPEWGVAPLFHSPTELKRRLIMIAQGNNTNRLLPTYLLLALFSVAASVSFATSRAAPPETAADKPGETKTAPKPNTMELTFPETATEAAGVFQRVAAQKLVAELSIGKADLVSVYNAAEAPLKNRGMAEKEEGSFAPDALTGSMGILLWGPYAEFDAGNYLVVYRYKLLEPAAGPGEKVFLDVSHDACTRSGIRLEPEELIAGKWIETAVPVFLADKKDLEFRFWPAGNRMAVDQIYVFRVTPRAAESGKTVQQAEEIPLAVPVPDRPGTVRSPHLENSGMIDVSGLASGTRVRCPYTGKYFRVP